MGLFKNKSYEDRKEDLIKDLKRSGYLRTPSVEEAIREVPREEFMPNPTPRRAYADTPQPIGYGQTISAPHMVAMMCEELKLREGDRVLEIGGGGGYHAAVVAEMVGEEGKVISTEIVEELAERAKETIRRIGLDDRVEVIGGDGVEIARVRKPFDRIYVAAAAPDISEVLLECLDEEGILLMPVGASFFSQLVRYEKKGDEVKTHSLGGCAFVPLTGEYGT